MTTITTTECDDVAAVFRWKFEYALRLGFDHAEADVVAEENLDTHYIESLVARGCPPRLAIELARE